VKKNYKIYILIIFILDLMFLGQWSYNKYIRLPEYPCSYQISTINKDKNIEKERLPDYGNLIKDHVIFDVADKEINITKDIEKYKFIKIIQIRDENNIDIDYFTSFLEIRNDFTEENIVFIYMVIGNFRKEKKKELVNIQNKYNITITNVSKSFLLDNYTISGSRCGYFIFLSKDNRVKLAISSIDPEVLKQILKQELDIKKG